MKDKLGRDIAVGDYVSFFVGYKSFYGKITSIQLSMAIERVIVDSDSKFLYNNAIYGSIHIRPGYQVIKVTSGF